MEFNETQAEILVNAWLLAREGKGQVLEDWAEPDAERLCEAGWLEQRTVDATGDTAWFWTAEAEGALDMSALNRSVEGRENWCAVTSFDVAGAPAALPPESPTGPTSRLDGRCHPPRYPDPVCSPRASPSNPPIGGVDGGSRSITHATADRRVGRLTKGFQN